LQDYNIAVTLQNVKNIAAILLQFFCAVWNHKMVYLNINYEFFLILSKQITFLSILIKCNV